MMQERPAAKAAIGSWLVTDERLRVNVWVRNGQTLHSFAAGPGGGFLVRQRLGSRKVRRGFFTGETAGRTPAVLLVSHRFCRRSGTRAEVVADF